MAAPSQRERERERVRRKGEFKRCKYVCFHAGAAMHSEDQ